MTNNRYIEWAKLPIFRIAQEIEINFNNGLNLIGGENGTGKTQFLTQLLTHSRNAHTPNIPQIVRVNNYTTNTQLRVMAFSPKRNSEMQNFQTITQQLRQQNHKLEQIIKTIESHGLNDKAFTQYRSALEAYAVMFEKKCRDGSDQTEKMNELTDEFNVILAKTFKNFKIKSVWNKATGSPDITILKNKTELQANELSCGEQEALSLIFGLYFAKEEIDVFLIDEPEIHLNWSIEQSVYKYLKWFCSSYNKQIIVTTHSRVLFSAEYRENTQFFYWNNNHIRVRDYPSKIEIDQLAGEIVTYVHSSYVSKKTFFVEDSFHETVITALHQFLNIDGPINIVNLNSMANVKAFAKTASNDFKDWNNAYFLIDGDNQKVKEAQSGNFIQIKAYSLESYFMDFKVLSIVFKTAEAKLKKTALELVKYSMLKSFQNKNGTKFSTFLAKKVTIKDLTMSNLASLDCTDIFKGLIKKHGKKKKFSSIVELYFKEKKSLAFLDKRLVSAVKKKTI